jgi:hypothetical protein
MAVTRGRQSFPLASDAYEMVKPPSRRYGLDGTSAEVLINQQKHYEVFALQDSKEMVERCNKRTLLASHWKHPF